MAYYSNKQTNKTNKVLRDTRPEKQDSRDTVSPPPKHQEVLQFPRALQRRHSNFITMSRYTNQPGDFSFFTPTQTPSHPPHPSQTLIQLSTVTHISRSPSVLRLTVTSWFALTRPHVPQRQQSYTSIWNQRNHSRMSFGQLGDPDYYSTQTFFGFLDLEIFFRGWRSHTPRAGGRLLPHSFDYTLARTGRISSSSLSH